MDEYIKRAEVLKHQRKMSSSDWSGAFWDYAVLAEDIEKMPTADVVEVVRCKDCVSSEMYEFGCSGVKRLACVEKEDGVVRFAQAVDPMGYCSGGNRKDGEGE